MLSNLSQVFGWRRANYEDPNPSSAGPTPSSPSESSLPYVRQLSSKEDVADLYDPDVDEFELTAIALAGVVPDDTFTVSEAVNSFGFGRLQTKLSLMTGLCWMADAMEVMILSILSPALYCSWGISSIQQASITTVVFFGMMSSSAMWAKFSDSYGRKTALFVSAILLFYYGFLSSFSPTYVWMVLLRGVVGVAVGCAAQGVTLYAEFIPLSQRGRSVVLLDSFWALGACLEVILALFVMPTLGWRYLLGISSLPSLLFILTAMWMPESARFHAAKGNYDKCLTTVRRMAEENKKPMPSGRLILDDLQDGQRGTTRDLFLPETRKTTVLLWLIWFSCSFCYYGVVLMTTEMFQSDGFCHDGPTKNETAEPGNCSSPRCQPLTTNDYIDLLWTTLAEFPGIFITVLIVDKLGRKNTMAMEFICFAAFVFPLLLCSSSRSVLTFLLFAARACISAVFQAAYVYTPEVYAAPLRAVGLAACSTVARLGAMSTPFLAQVLFKSSPAVTVSIYGVLGVTGAVLALLLPIETKGQA